MILASTDPQVIVALIAAVAGITVAAIQSGRAARAAQTTAESVGTANGHGPLHDHLRQISDQQDRMYARLDAGDERFDRIEQRFDGQVTRIAERMEHDARLRDVGQRRQERMEEVELATQAEVTSVKVALGEVLRWQADHTSEDAASFRELADRIDNLTKQEDL